MRCPLLLLLLALAAGAARADIIHLRTGRLEGQVIERADGHVKIRTTTGIITTVEEKEVLEVEKRETPHDIYQGMADKLRADDAEGHFALALWCRDHELRDEMTAELVAVLKLNPNHERARAELGHVKTDKGWLTREEAMQAQGMVLFKGRWVSKDDAEKLESEEKNKRLILGINAAVYKIHTGSKAVVKENTERLGNVSDVAVAWKMVSLLGDRDEDVRTAACASLARMKYADAVPALLRRALLDSKEPVRNAAMDAVLQMDHDRACDALYQVIAGLKLAAITTLGEQRTACRLYSRIASVLGKLGDIRSVPFLVEILYPSVEIVEAKPDTPSGGLGIRQLGLYRAGGEGLEAVDVTQSSMTLGTGSAQPVPPEPDRYFFNQAAEDALKKLTGQNLGVLPRDWQKWWREHGTEVLRKADAGKRLGDGKADRLLEEEAREPR